MRLLGKIIKELFLVLIVLIWTVPILWIIVLSLKSNIEIFNYPLSLPDPPKFINYVVAWKRINFPILAKNTLIIAFFTLLLGLTFTTMSSFAIARFRLSAKLQNVIFVYFITGMFLPVFVMLSPLFVLINKLGFYDTYLAVILPYVGGCASMNSLILVGAMKGIPQSLEEAAILDGCGVTRILVSILVPILKPAIATVLLLHFLGVWNEFPLVSVMISSTSKITIALAASFFKGLYTVDYATQSAAVMIVTIPQLVVFIIFQRYVIEGIAAGAVKG
jgi:raffinose/stachyose/melibiose transport system permease protein